VAASGSSPAAGLRRGLERSRDAFLAGALLAWDLWVSAAGMRARGEQVPDGMVVSAAVLAVASCAPLPARRHHPLAVLTATTAVMVAGFELAPTFPGAPDQPLAWLVLSVLVALATVGDRTRWPAAVGAAAAVLLVVSLSLLLGRARAAPPDLLDQLPLLTLLFGGPTAAGALVRHRREAARERERALARAAAERERRAVIEERARIARELHDIVAHHVSSIVVQAGAAHRSYDDDRDGARSALASIRSTGSETLVAMRRLLGILRSGDGAADLAPQAGLAQLDALVEHFRRLGLVVTIEVVGQVRSIPVDVDLSAYRVVQEALTNVLKHAGPTAVAVAVRYGTWSLEVRVDDDGPPPTSPAGAATAGGHGLIGMRERMALYAGTLHVGARGGGGWTVRARFPLPGAEGPA